MLHRIKLPIWILPLGIALVVAVFGWWGDARLRQTIEQHLEAELTATLNANVTALEIWTTNQMKLATLLADEPKTRALAVRIFEDAGPPDANGTVPRERPDIEEWAGNLRPRLARAGYEIADLVSTNFLVSAHTVRGRLRRGLPVSDEHLSKFSELFTSGQPVLITPFKPRRPPMPDRPPPSGPGRGSGRGFAPGSGPGPGPFREGDGAGMRRNDVLRREPAPGAIRAGEAPPSAPLGPPGPPGPPGRFQRADFLLMQVAAPVRDDRDVVRGALALVINPDAEFTRILTVARSGLTGETYAFDQRGLMISRSRFDEQLKVLGLITNLPEASSALNLRLSDPGAEMPAKIVPEELALATRPLTRIAAAAVAGGSGVDVRAARDYRGVPVVGAWRWLPRLGFGVATQIDASEAYRQLHVLKLVFTILVLLLLLGACIMFVFTYAIAVWRRRLGEAELRLKQLGQYTLEEKIGEGGMGVVYRGRHALMRRDTAVKLLLPERADPEAIARFEREVCLTCHLTHPNTIQVYDYGHTPEGIFYYVMEYLRGMNLHHLVLRFGPQPQERVIHILTQVCASLAEAHGRGLVHRDIKPANVFLCDRGGVADCVKVLDFGLVREFRGTNAAEPKARGAKGVFGTPAFMPPETIRNPALSDPRSDLYAVGALGYWLLTATEVFEAPDVPTLCEKHLNELPVPPSRRTANPVSPELDDVILSCLAKDPGQRPQSAGELSAGLLKCPEATAWDPGRRAAWWAQNGAIVAAGASPDAASSASRDGTIRVDLAQRNGG